MFTENQFDELKKDFLDSIVKAEKVLIGIGKEFEVPSDGDKALSGYYMLKGEADGVEDLYSKLFEIVKEKDYRVITLCADDRIYNSFSREKTVSPCGTIRGLQCNNNCNGELYEIDEATELKVNRIVEKLGAGEVILDEDYPRCPNCGEKLVFNNVYANNYNENGYLDDFAEYKKWLQSTVNKELVIIELGVGMRFPTVIRLPFDKMCFYNQKSKFYRIHDSLYQHTSENSERGIPVKMTGKRFLELL